MRITAHLGRRMTALVATGAFAATLGLVVAPAAQAAPVLGTLTLTPASGTESTGLTAALSAPCPAGAEGIVGYMTGTGITAENSVIQSFRSVAQSFQVSSIFRDVFQANAIASPSGVYTVRFACIGSDFFTEVGEFSQDVTFTPRGGTNNANYVTALAATTTTLSAPTPADMVGQGTSVALHATVTSASGTPAGTVQFKAGSTNVGAPVALVSGAADLSTTALPAGALSLTAVYAPVESPHNASTSAAVPYAVAGATTTNGSAKVGGTMGCTAVTGGTKSYKWLRNGVATGITTATVLVPASWANTTITCELTSTKNAAVVSKLSAGRKVALGSAPVAKARPKVVGTAKVGKVLTCNRGVWSPAPNAYRYQWYRGKVALKGKTAVKYKAVKADKKKLVSCRVVAVKTGYASGVATSAGRKIA